MRQTICPTGKGFEFSHITRIYAWSGSPICAFSTPYLFLPTLATSLSAMLLRFTTTDMLNASLVDVHTGNVAYKILTSRQSDPTSSSSSVSSDFVPEKKSHLPSSPSSPSASEALRRTYITSGVDGKTLVDISWNGRRPDITIGDEKIGGLSDLFETSAAEIMFVLLSSTTSQHSLINSSQAKSAFSHQQI